MDIAINGFLPRDLAIDIAIKTLDGEYDLLLACRDISNLRESLPEIPDELMDTFVAVSSEIDDLPLGPERELWAEKALKIKDIEAEKYREEVRIMVMEKLTKLWSTLAERH